MAEITLASTIGFALAFLVTTILHEIAHAVTGLFLGSRPILHSTYVEHHGLTPGATAAVAAAGPLFSLFQGLVVWALLENVSSAPAATRLFALWLAFHGLVNFFGYLMNTPYFPMGDSGKVARYFGVGRFGQSLWVAAGLLANIAIGVVFIRPFLELAPSAAAIAAADLRSGHIFYIAVLPWVIGAALAAIASYPPPHPMTLLYPLLSGMATLVSWLWAAGISDVEVTGGFRAAGDTWMWVAALAAVAGVFRFVLAPGIALRRMVTEKGVDPD